MNVAMNIDTTKYLVIGAGITGLSVIEYLLSREKDIRIMDTRVSPPNAKHIDNLLPSSQINYGNLDSQWLDEADVIVLSPGMSPHDSAIVNSIGENTEVIGDVELFAREASKPYIAVTGSNGKSTVTTLANEILVSQGIKAKAGANIGEPALTLLSDASIDMYVLELSSFQLETCSSIKPESSVVLNVSDDHLDRHNNLQEYAAIKSSIYKNAKNKVVPRDDNANIQVDGDFVTFGMSEPEGNDYGVRKYDDGTWLVKGSEKLMLANELRLVGDVGILNTLAALALTENYIEDYSKAVNAIKLFDGLPHRCQLILEEKGIKWIDDSKGTNIGATVSAIKSIDTPKILILGGVHKGGSLKALIDAVQNNVKHVITFGQDKKVFTQAMQGVVDVTELDLLSEAVSHACKIATKGDAVLFSPACASMDMFVNYIERGLEFQSQVKKCLLGANHGSK